MKIVLAATALLFSGLIVAAEPAASPPVNGTIQAVKHGSLRLRTPDLQQVKIILGDQTRIVNTRKATLAELKGGDFIGTTAETRDGKLVATEVHIFAEALRGTGEGHYPWNQPNTTMTNGAVQTMTNGAVAQQGSTGGALTITVTYKGGEQQVQVPATVAVTRLEIGKRSLLKRGRQVTAFGRGQPDGSLAADMLLLPLPAAH